MSLVLQSSGGGQITIQEPATASNFTQTLPAASGEVMVSGNQPAFSAYSANSQTGLTSGVFVKVALNTETFDTNNNFDKDTNYRFTPTVAGYYQINGAVFMTGNLTGYQLSFYKNGSINYSATYNAAATSALIMSGSNLFFCNGTTDYIELYAFATTSSGTWTIGTSSAATLMSGVLVRAA
jgi:hypothetical protein